jgi:hypothetical protein
MKRVAIALLAILGAGLMVPAAAASEPRTEVQVAQADGTPVVWERWVSRHAPVVILVWASWAPRAADALTKIDDLRAACSAHGLQLTVVDVQEPRGDAHAALSAAAAGWLHDRHGSILKRYRVIRVPSLVILDKAGDAVARLEATPAAIAGWDTH